MVHSAPSNLASRTKLIYLLAEFRGPGVRHQFEDGGDEYDIDLHQNGRGRIIFLGDGKEIEAGEEEEDDERDVDMHSDETEASHDDSRRDREETPAPEAHESSSLSEHTAMETDEKDETTQAPTRTASEGASVKLPPNAIPETAVPDKLVSPPESYKK